MYHMFGNFHMRVCKSNVGDPVTGAFVATICLPDPKGPSIQL